MPAFDFVILIEDFRRLLPPYHPEDGGSSRECAGAGKGIPGPTDTWITLVGLARETSTIRLGSLMTSANVSIDLRSTWKFLTDSGTPRWERPIRRHGLRAHRSGPLVPPTIHRADPVRRRCSRRP